MQEKRQAISIEFVQQALTSYGVANLLGFC